MLLAVLSDIHGNLEAFTAVLADLDQAGARAVFFCGDAVGYGPDPEACVTLLAEREIPCVLGNHEAGVLSEAERAFFNPPAREQLLLTESLLSRESLAFIASWPRSRTVAREEGGLRFVHGCPPEAVSSYLFEQRDADLARIMAELPERVSFVGHTHELMLVSTPAPRPGEPIKAENLMRRVPGKPAYILERGRRHVVNVGSVGQPRDGDNRAKYVLYETETGTLTIRAVDYDRDATAAKIKVRGFSPGYANRLY